MLNGCVPTEVQIKLQGLIPLHDGRTLGHATQHWWLVSLLGASNLDDKFTTFNLKPICNLPSLQSQCMHGNQSDLTCTKVKCVDIHNLLQTMSNFPHTRHVPVCWHGHTESNTAAVTSVLLPHSIQPSSTGDHWHLNATQQNVIT